MPQELQVTMMYGKMTPSVAIMLMWLVDKFQHITLLPHGLMEATCLSEYNQSPLPLCLCFAQNS